MTLFRGKYRVESSRLRGWNYASRGWYFVTICTHEHRCWFGTITSEGPLYSELGQIARQQWIDMPAHYKHVSIDAFVLMPNHLHGIVVIEGRHQYSPGMSEPECMPSGLEPPRSGSLSSIIRSYKAGVSRVAAETGHLGFQWQPRFHDRVLRDNDEVNAVREYIQNNAENWLEDQYFAAKLET